MADNILLTLGIDASALQSGIRSAGSAIDGLDSKVNALSNTFKLTAASIAAVGAALSAVAAIGIKSFTDWGGQLDELKNMFGGTNEQVASFAVGLGQMGISVDEGTAGFTYFTRQLQATKDALAKSGEVVAATRDQITSVTEDLAAKRAEIAANVAEQITGIETSLADNIETMQANLADRLQSLQDERVRSEKQMEKSLSDLQYTTKERLESAHTARERRRIRQDALRRKAEIIQANADKQAELNAQEAKERAKEARDEQRANRLAQKQIDAANRVADKQIAAADKAADKQIAALEKVIAKQNQLTISQTPFLKALDLLGLKFEQVNGKDFYAQIAIIMDAFKKLPEGSKASAAALDLFGKSGFKWLEFLRSDRGTWEETARRFHLIIDPEEAHKMEVNMAGLQLAFTGLGTVIGKNLAPTAMRFITALTDAVAKIIPTVDAIMTRLSGAFEKGGFKGLFDELGKILTEKGGLLDQIKGLITRVTTWLKSGDGQALIKTISDAIGAGLTVALGAATWMIDAVGELFKQLRLAMEAQTPTRMESIIAVKEGGPIIQKSQAAQLVDALAKMLAAAVNTSAELLGLMGAIVDRMIGWIKDPNNRAKIGELADAFAVAFTEGLTKHFAGFNWYKVIFTSLNPVESSAKDFAKSTNLGQQILDGLFSTFVKTPDLTNPLTDIYLGIKSFFKISSPSKLMADEVGAPIGAGMLAGLQGFVASSVSDFLDVGRSIVDLVNRGVLLRLYAAINSVKSAWVTVLQYIFMAVRPYALIGGQTIGAAIASGIQLGIALATPALMAQVASLVARLVGILKSLLIVHSPSGLMAKEIGEPMGAGILQGMQRSLAAMPAVLQSQLAPAGGSSYSFAYSPTHNWRSDGAGINQREWERAIDDAVYKKVRELMGG